MGGALGVLKGFQVRLYIEAEKELQIPTPRWTAYDAKYFNVKMGPEVTMQMQERA
jgi:hypothetical protein